MPARQLSASCVPATVNASRWRPHGKAAEKYKLRLCLAYFFDCRKRWGNNEELREDVCGMSEANRTYRFKEQWMKATSCSQKP